MKNILFMTLLMLVSSVSFAQRSASHIKLSSLIRDSKGITVRMNQTVVSDGYSSRAFEVNKGLILLPGDKYTYRLHTTFEKDINRKMLPLKQGTKLSVEEVKDGGGGFGFDSSFYLSASTPTRPIGDGRYAFSTVYLQILGSDFDSIEKLTLGDVEKVFEGMISFQIDR